MSDLFTSDDFSDAIEIAPGVRTRVLTRGNLMFSLVELDEGAESPIHDHPEVQMGLVLEGTFERRQGDAVKLLRAGDGFYVPPGVPHGGRAVGGRCRILDVFTPPRDRYAKRIAMSDTYARLSSAAVATAGGRRVGVILGLTPAWREAAIAGPAFTASGVAGDNLVLHRALARAPRGAVLVAALRGDTPAGHWGELMCIAAAAAGIAGVVMTGTVRDLVRVEAHRFPVFHKGVGPRPAAKSHPGTLGAPVKIAGVTIAPGDLVVADADGIAVVPRALVDDVLADVAELERREAQVIQAVERGTSTLDALGLS